MILNIKKHHHLKQESKSKKEEGKQEPIYLASEFLKHA